ncbi:MAG: UDP-N-acetylmuramoyl-L-alanine--D-glutamate ligase [Planctomycetota bacterium]
MDYAGKRITVMGLGRFGGGVGVTQFLSSRGATLTVTDMSSPDQLAESVAAVRGLPGVSLVLGEHREQDFRDADLIVANPAVKPINAYLQIARDAGVPITTEIVLLVRELPDRKRTIGVTGSAGKSTTTAMIGHILRKAFGQEGDTPNPSRDTPGVWVGGNLGGSLLPTADQIRPDDWVVLELSSFMLHYLREEEWSPHVAVVTNLSPNHLDWHGTVEAYRIAKHSILDCQQWGDKAILPKNLRWMARIGTNQELVDTDLLENRETSSLHADQLISLPGIHNFINAVFAQRAVSRATGQKFIPRVGTDFIGLPHRLQFVGKLDMGDGEARFYNDSKSTTPEASIRAMNSFVAGSVHTILGGYDKGVDLSELCRIAAQCCVGVYTIGATGERIAEAMDQSFDQKLKTLWVERCEFLDIAVSKIKKNVRPGDVVLLSPGCASWDQFANYEERGERFIALVRGEA